MLDQIKVKIYGSILRHVKMLQYQTDPAISRFALEPKSNRTFIFVLIIFGLNWLMGTIGLQYLHTGSVDLRSIPSSPCIFSHQILPQEIWRFFDMNMIIDSVFVCPIAAQIAFSKNINPRYQLTIVPNLRDPLRFIFDSKSLTEAECREIAKMHRVKRALHLLSTLFYTIAFLLFGISWWQNGIRVIGIARIIYALFYWLFVFPLFIFYIIYVLFALFTNVMLACRYLVIVQRRLSTQLERINDQINKRHDDRNDRKALQHYRRYLAINRRYMTVAKAIAEYNRYIGPLLSFVLPCFVLIQGYITYGLFLIDAVPTHRKQHFLLAFMNVNASLVAIIVSCAIVIRANERFERANRRFYIGFSCINGFRVTGLRHMLLVENFQKSNRFHKYAFKIVGGRRITSGMFLLILSYMCTFFMFVLKSQQYA